MIEQASLVIGEGNWAVKSDSLLGYKINGGKYYPREMSVVRATTGTRINEDGLVELVPYNLLSYSEQFDNAYWSTQDATITANTTTAPNGTLTADTFTRTANTGFLYSTNPLALITGSYVISVYAKANAISSFRLDLGTSGFSQGTTCTFDLSNGTAGTPTVYGSTTSVVASIENVGNGWYRCSLSANFIAGNYYAELAITTTGSIYAWGFQLVEGSSALDYLPTTDRLDVARIDYSSGSGALLVEPQRTNLLTYSSSFDNAAWEATNASVTSNVIISPSGVQDADLLQSIDTNAPRIRQTTTQTGNDVFTFSCFAKKGNVNFLILRNIAVNVGGGSRAWFNLDTGVVGTVNSGLTASIESVGNGWYRCSISGTTDSSPLNLIDIALSATDNTFAGVASENIYLWGAQLELGSYATSLIPTQAATVTRNADVISKTGITDLIGQTEGVVFLEINSAYLESYTQRVFTISDDTNNNVIGFQLTSANQLTFYVENGGANQVVITKNFPAITLGQNVKIAAAYKANDFVLYVNGVQIGTDTSGTVPATSVLRYANPTGSSPYIGKINAAALWQTRLTNDQLATLTTI